MAAEETAAAVATAASAATSAPAATAATTVATVATAMAAVATSELEADLGGLNLSAAEFEVESAESGLGEDADAQMNEDTNDLLPGLDDNDEDGTGREVIPFPSYTTRPPGNPAQPLLDAGASRPVRSGCCHGGS